MIATTIPKEAPMPESPSQGPMALAASPTDLITPTDLATLAADLRRQAVEAEACLAALACRRRSVALDHRLGRIGADALTALDREIDGHRKALTEIADALPELEQRLASERADHQRRALVSLEQLLRDMVIRRNELADRIASERQPSSRLIDEFGLLSRQVAGLGHDLFSVTGKLEHQNLNTGWRPGAGLPDEVAALSAHSVRGRGAGHQPRPPIDRPWAALLAVAQGNE